MFKHFVAGTIICHRRHTERSAAKTIMRQRHTFTQCTYRVDGRRAPPPPPRALLLLPLYDCCQSNGCDFSPPPPRPQESVAAQKNIQSLNVRFLVNVCCFFLSSKYIVNELYSELCASHYYSSLYCAARFCVELSPPRCSLCADVPSPLLLLLLLLLQEDPPLKICLLFPKCAVVHIKNPTSSRADREKEATAQ